VPNTDATDLPATLGKQQPNQALLTAVLLLIAISMLFAILYQWSFEREHSRLQGLLNAQAIELDRQLENLDVIPKVLSSDPRLIDLLLHKSQTTRQQANQLLRSVEQVTQVSDAYLLDITGLTLAASNQGRSNSFVGNNYSFRPYFKDALAGKQSSQYAVGITTGVPGYFIAHPVFAQQKIIGVVVLKMTLSHLPDSWRAQANKSLLLDQLGIVILATDTKMLYARTQQLNLQQRDAATNDSFYPSARKSSLNINVAARTVKFSGQSFVAANQTLKNQNWQLMMLSTKASVLLQAAAYCLAALVLACFLWLMLRSYRYQRDLAFSEQKNARQLEVLVSERTQALEKAQQELIVESNFAVLGRLSAAINHEVNQPLASLRFNLASLRQMTEQTPLALDDLQQTVIDCDRTTKRIARVVEALRSIARPVNASFETVPLKALLLEVVQTVKRERPQLSKHLHCPAVESELEVQGNRVLLQQALLNLLYNAFDAVLSVEQPRVDLKCSVVAQTAKIQVIDNGSGIEPELQDKLFTPFTQGSSRTNGLGLGLALAHQIAERHHGDLSFSPEQNGGSCFSLSLPTIKQADKNHD